MRSVYRKKATSPPTAAKEAGTMFETAAPEEVAAAELPEVDVASSEVEVPVAEADVEEPVLVLVAVLEVAKVVFVSFSTPGHFIMQARMVLKASEPGIMSLG